MVRQIIFRQRRQRPGESVHQYVADLRCLASLCKFNALEDEMNRDQIAEPTVDPMLREKLFMAPDDLPLSKVVELAFQLESAAQLASRLAAPAPAPPHATSLAQTVAPLAQPYSDLEVNVAGHQGATGCRPCGNCGSSSHPSRAPACPAMGQRCQRCGKMNHFSRVCRSAPASASPRTRSSRPPSPTTIHSVGSSAKPFISSMKTGRTKAYASCIYEWL
ncbi:uncharacterized protein LOC118341631 [Morone saxatilis]|uniref:uncharacterized protein LOC118341631 n=1 Tax=Morone saxatilis TaxID=34816 RepID=UPI0015E25602|nr:uncharacterized protein LOC118341631 [Morone saxatilis]